MKQCSVSTRSQHSLEGSGRSPSTPAGTATGLQRSQQQMLVKNSPHVSIWSGIAKRNLANSPGQPSHAVVMKREIVTLLLLCILCISFSTSKVFSVPFSFYLTNVFRCKASKNIHLEGYFGDSSCGCLSSKKGWDNLEDLRNYCRTKISHVDRDVSVHTAFKSASRNSTLHKID